MATMKAVRIHTHGGLETLVYEDAPRPTPLTGEVLIRVRVARINPIDWKIRGAFGKEIFSHQMPLILGWDVAGTIEAIGPEVETFKPRDPVYGYTSLRRDGAYAEFTIAKQGEIALKPASLDFVQAAAIPIAALTTLIDAGRLKPFVETVLPLSEARQAQEMSQSGRTRGKIVLQVS